MAVRQRETQGKVADHCVFMVSPTQGAVNRPSVHGESSGAISRGDKTVTSRPQGVASCVTSASRWVASCVTMVSVWVASCVTTASVWVASCVSTTSVTQGESRRLATSELSW